MILHQILVAQCGGRTLNALATYITNSTGRCLCKQHSLSSDVAIFMVSLTFTFFYFCNSLLAARITLDSISLFAVILYMT
jgi:hypothetical protein